MSKFPFYKQHDAMDCGPTCLRMVAKHYGVNHSIQALRQQSEIGKDGVNLLGIAQAAEQMGFRTLAVKAPLKKMAADAPLPCIVHWNQVHFVVVYRIKKNQIYVADPAKGLLKYTATEFESAWATTVEEGERAGIALLLEPTPKFFEDKDTLSLGGESSKMGFSYLYSYVWRYRNLWLQLGLGLLVGSVLQLVLPFLTQSVVDTGIQTHNLHFIYLVLVAQLMLFVGRMSVDFIRSWILLHISTRINLSILSDFLAKLLRLPISFFDTKLTGDILQRIGDHSRIESFLTGTSLNTLFSMINLLVLGVVLATYHLTIFGVFALFSALYTGWIVFFLRYRRQLDHKRFALASQNQSSLIQLITGIQEIKMNNAEHLKRWQWENLQVRQFKLSMKGLEIGQYQQAGAMFLNEGKNIVITFLAATAVVNGQLTLGAMMALQYIVGQMNSPVEQLIQFVQHWQDAKISLERLNEIHEMEDESNLRGVPSLAPKGGIDIVPPLGARGLFVQNLSFTYPGAGNEPVLKNINLHIPAGKITAIVGTSGSGKTTLLKLLLRFYPVQKGEIRLSSFTSPDCRMERQGTGLNTIPHRQWRSQCGTVLQDGFIFSDTIANNIAVGDEVPNLQKLLHAVKVANIQEFIEALPLGYNTKIGTEGNGISQGQRQRLLIARAVYKDPDFLFFDEATNALDANNERVIMENLEEFFKSGSAGRRTVVVVAHRLSTVKNADQIVVMEKGEIVETGTHFELTRQQGKYYELVKNQLELGN
ncbi:peptidase domain-containing ABC transporter [Runella salmonicolor]|uniref:Peptidase domain-containing ABC transporter n=1 Tax=Runella salmonicolor TaxID=2950278 RepID=A0ABT1FMX7_9BACT|nr:peptidase domain-containing ABC transporter [Runella salmonicolor]MCP1383081.1 peptidase domain-containing ABC transporter [Runella salmonicolor]